MVHLIGFGDLGRFVLTDLEKRGYEIESVVDANERLIGKKVEEYGDYKTDVEITGSLPTDGYAILCTTSHLDGVCPTLRQLLEHGVSVVSTCEELVFPFLKHRDIANSIDDLARKNGARVLGTGINPGFVMDLLALVLTAPCLKVERVEVTRVMSSTRRRPSYQKKIGTGLTLKEFSSKASKGEITCHVGLQESAAMIGEGLGWKLQKIAESGVEAVIADEEVKTDYAAVEKGMVAGVKSRCIGEYKEGKIDLEFISHCLVKNPYDSVHVYGDPDIVMRIEGGLDGDKGTVAMVLNSIPRLMDQEPGLVTMLDLPPPRCSMI